jgi:hypothetical protein
VVDCPFGQEYDFATVIGQANASEATAKFAQRAFQDLLGLIRIALVNHYGLTDAEASELETDLYLWFQRFCQRPGSPAPSESQRFLLVACCQFARDYQRYVVGLGERSLDDRLRGILDRDPSDVVGDFDRGLQLLRFRYHNEV